MAKSRNTAGGWNFITDSLDGSMDYLTLQTTNTASTINYNAPTSTVFSYNDNNTNTTVIYCIAEKQGYSKVGTYYGNGQADGTFAYCGFKPAWIMTKNTQSAEPWVVYDTERNPHNGADLKLTPNTEDGDNGNSQVGGTSNNIVDILSTGFKMRSNNNATNESAKRYVFVAFAESPFVSSSGVPNTAR